ncbi:DUF4347 domain-containing protein [Gloeocapsa sp. PCC 73106]|uniref:DUF4347 domain-containing protein n=1 Tax=Gloeocapsa sp. PCC 73106 TaxID=102232 RepID=UPI0002AC4A49|nr:DUF4347 domain-containing protein [Gloeocapsa sp. PCC 73106]ELR97824.1 hypothetical protein GLO73106DRAFT_00016410 [Gloeocapsa sp. PCC 73106]
MGAGDAGAELLSKLHQITGSAIAASSTLVGNTAKGGNWELDKTQGNITTSIPFSETAREAYTEVLVEFVVNTLDDENDGINTGGVSLRDAINQANVREGEDTIEFASNLNGVITLTEGAELSISDDLIIIGPGAENIISNRNKIAKNTLYIF